MALSPSILLVDDELLLAEITADWLRRKGCNVLTAQNGSQAWEILQEIKVDIVISDVRMPVMDGVELLAKITASGPGAPRVILVTGHSDFDRRNAYNLGVEIILDKPVQLQRLLDSAGRALSSKKHSWSTLPPPCDNATIRNSFRSVTDAISRGSIALGRGGFCIADGFYDAGDCVPLDLHFTADKQGIVGQGIVRWSDRKQHQLGVEIAYLEEDCRDWVITLLAGLGICSFIPRETIASL
jgi:CheY-like chemotaxis protein